MDFEEGRTDLKPSVEILEKDPGPHGVQASLPHSFEMAN